MRDNEPKAPLHFTAFALLTLPVMALFSGLAGLLRILQVLLCLPPAAVALLRRGCSFLAALAARASLRR